MKKSFLHRLSEEALGLILLSFSFLSLVSLASFFYGNFSYNLLGKVGYGLAYVYFYLFGLTAYIVAVGIAYFGYRILMGKKISYPTSQILFAFSALFCVCLILSVLSDTIDYFFTPIRMNTIVESFYTDGTYTTKIVRYNFGGIPAYYFYKDVPLLNLRHLLSISGTLITSFTLCFVFTLLALDVTKEQILSLLLRIITSIRKWSKKSITYCKSIDWHQILFEKKDDTQSKEMVPIQQTVTLHSAKTTLYQDKAPAPAVTRIDATKEGSSSSLQEDDKDITIHTDTTPKVQLKEKFSSSTSFLNRAYQLPPLTLLTNAKQIDQPSLNRELKVQATILEEALSSFGIEAKVGEINCGPTITSFEVHPAIGVKVQKIKGVEDDLALNLQAKSIRIIAPIPGKAVVGVEIPSLYPQEVGFKEMLYHYTKRTSFHTLPVLLGKTVSGEDVTADLTKMPHCIIAGATGSGKSVCINTLIMSLIMTKSPDELKLILIDPKKVELTPYGTLPHLISPVITEAKGAYAALCWLVKEMQLRYDILKQLGVRNIAAFNKRVPDTALEESLSMDIPRQMYSIVCIIDEFADLMMTTSADIETPIARIAQMARAVGIHLVLATQRPSREVITGIIKANFPTRIAFKVASRVNSQIILDETGAESLLGNGDMLFLPPGASTLVRAQGSYIRDEDITRVVDYIMKQRGTNYIIKSFDTYEVESATSQENSEYSDELYPKALELVVQTRNASTTFLQRKLKVGYARAASLIDELEARKVIGPSEGSKGRKVLVDGDMQNLFDT